MTTALTAVTSRGLLAEGARRLAEAGLPTARQDAEWLLADVLGRERFALKTDIRKLKGLGLTLSLEVGYEISPRGQAFLDATT